jgi:RimJ/RimL family protein N-acetyltransferase
VVLLANWLFALGASRVFLTVVEDNHSSTAVAERAGFLLEGPTGEHSRLARSTPRSPALRRRG